VWRGRPQTKVKGKNDVVLFTFYLCLSSFGSD
jgi:hypothetical protein